MPRMGFKPAIPAFEQAKTLRALGSAATVIGRGYLYHYLKKTVNSYGSFSTNACGAS
jgi:hypothetical protein